MSKNITIVSTPSEISIDELFSKSEGTSFEYEKEISIDELFSNSETSEDSEDKSSVIPTKTMRRQVQRQIKKHQKKNCEICGSEYNLTVHHCEKHFLEIATEFYNSDIEKTTPNWKVYHEKNSKFQTLCKKCHSSTHGDVQKFNKGNYSEPTQVHKVLRTVLREFLSEKNYKVARKFYSEQDIKRIVKEFFISSGVSYETFNDTHKQLFCQFAFDNRDKLFSDKLFSDKETIPTKVSIETIQSLPDNEPSRITAFIIFIVVFVLILLSLKKRD